MIPVKSQQKYKCDFCKKRSVKSAMERHEKICFRNPDRYCDFCDNKGEVDEGIEDYTYMIPCIYCSKFDKKQLEEIEAREKKLEEVDPREKITEVPF